MKKTLILFIILQCCGILSAKALRDQKLYFIVNCGTKGYLAKAANTDTVMVRSSPSPSAVWKIYRMGASRCFLRNYVNKELLTLNTATGELGFSEQKAPGSYWMQVNRGGKRKFYLKSLSKGEYKDQLVSAEGDSTGLGKDRKQKKFIWKMQRLKNYLHVSNVLKKAFGTKTFDLILLRKDQQVWAKEDIVIPMSKKSSTISVELPFYTYNKIRLVLKEPYGKRLALSEVKVIEGFENIAQGCKVTCSEEYGKPYKGIDVSSANIVDNITDHYKVKKKNGFWLINNREGWIEIDLTEKLKQKED